MSDIEVSTKTFANVSRDDTRAASRELRRNMRSGIAIIDPATQFYFQPLSIPRSVRDNSTHGSFAPVNCGMYLEKSTISNSCTILRYCNFNLDKGIL